MFVLPLIAQLTAAAHLPMPPRDSAALLKRVKDAQFRFTMDWRYQIEWDAYHPTWALRSREASRHYPAVLPQGPLARVPAGELPRSLPTTPLKAPTGSCFPPGGMPDDDVDPHSWAAHGIRNPHNDIKYRLCPRFSLTPISVDEPGLIDRRLSLEAQDTIRALRRALLKKLDSAGALLPGDRWIVAQRARTYLDQGDAQAANRVAKGCRAEPWWCAALDGYVLTSIGDFTAARRALDRAHATLSPEARSRWEDIEYLLPAAGRKAYTKLLPAARDSLNAIAWWLADPLFLEDGNDRLAEQMLRRFLVELYDNQTTLWRDWRKYYQGPIYVESVLRYGWPPGPFSQCSSAMNSFGWPIPFRRFDTRALFLGCPTGPLVYPGPQFHTMPHWHAITNPLQAVASDWDVAPARDVGDYWDRSWWATEFYVRRAGPLVPVDYQVAMLRRQTAPLFVGAMQWDSAGYTFRPAPRMIAAAIFMTGPTSPRLGVRDTNGTLSRRVMTATLTPGRALLSLEMVPVGGIGAAGQSRFAVTAPRPLEDLKPGELSLSDPVLVSAAPGQEEPRDFRGALGRMLATTTLRNPDRVGVYWELYGLGDGDTVTVSVKLLRKPDANSTQRRNMLGIGRAVGDSLMVSWREPRRGDPAPTVVGGVTIRPRGVVLNVSQLNAGGYTMDVTVQRDSTSAMGRRELAIVR
jgi:hypothetical protein